MEYIEDEEELPPLNEGDEALSLYDILVERDACLNEEELWALCRECCLVLEVVNNSPEMFQTLCITPDTVAFDRAGNVCFLDLDKDPEPLYIPPEYDNVGNSYKSHLFSLGMTLLYAAEYNGEPGRPEISAELREVFGCMTAEGLETRPDLESVITECEEQLCGKSSQEVCCNIGAFAAPFTPAPDVNSVSLTDVTEGLSDYLNSQSSLIPASGANSVNLPGPQEHSTPSGSPFKVPHQYVSPPQEEDNDDIDTTQIATEEEGDMPMRGMLTGMPLPTGNRERNSTRKKNKGLSVTNNLNFSTGSNEILRSNLSSNVTRNTSEKVETILGAKGSENNNSNPYSTGSSDLLKKKDGVSKPPIPRKPSKNDLYKKMGNDSGMVDDNHIQSEIESSIGERISHILDSGDKLQKPNSQAGESTQYAAGIPPVPVELTRTDSTESAEVKGIKRSKKKQGLTISEVVDSLNRDLQEEELWALCKEGTTALQRKKKHLPAYLSPDTLLLRENGNLSFKAIPEDKPLEVIFMAPELQQRGQLSDKTCLYGLGVTLRCAGGKKYGSASNMSVTPPLQDLLKRLGESDPEKRPTLEETAEICDAHETETGISTTITCQDLFQEAFSKFIDESAPRPPSSQKIIPAPVAMPKPKPKLPPKPPSPMLSAFRPIKGPGIKPQIGTSTSSFSTVKTDTEQSHNGSVPTAFTSSATHFKPIVIHSASPPPQTSAKSQNAQEEDCQPNDKDKEVVRKLKELKKNLMKHRQPMVAKDLENDEKEGNNAISVEKKFSESKKPSKPVEEASSKTEKRSAEPGAIHSLLEEIQKQGSMPDTQSLASAIAQYLQSHMKQGDIRTPQAGSHIGAPSPMYPPPGVGLPPPGQMFPPYAQPFTSLNIPAHQHQQLLGQTMTLPSMNQFGSGLMPGYPLQVQLQQDPRTGFLQMVPVGIVPMGSTQGSQANSDEFVNVNDDISRMSDPGRSPMPRAKFASDGSNSDTLTRKRHVRSSRDSVVKDPNALHGLQNSTSPSSQPQAGTGWHSGPPSRVNQAEISQVHSEIKQYSSHSMAFQSNSGQEVSSSNQGQFYPDNTIPRNQSVPKTISQSGVGGYSTLQPQRTRSNSSSPSPSKDSGVSGMNGVYKPPPPGSLMERLLNSNVSLSQQKKMGRIVHLLREEYAFDGYMENGVEDINMAEYILSLGNLKWETFASAITEKYSDLYWKVDVLVSLYQAVNGAKPMFQNQFQGQGRGAVARPSDITELPPPDVLRPKPEEQEHSSSSMPETNQTKSYKRHTTADMAVSRNDRDTLPPKRPQSVNAQAADTSDSTDNENFETRRRYRKKHTEKSKSSSMHNLASPAILTVAPCTATEENVDSNTDEIPPKPENAHLLDTNTQQPNTAPSDGSNQQEQNEYDKDNQGAITNQLPKQNDDHIKHESSVSSRSSSVSDVRGTAKLTRHMSRLSLNEEARETATQLRRTHILYHYTTLQLNLTQEMEKFIQDIDEENPDSLQLKLASLDQEIMMQRRTKKKTQTFFNKLTDQPKMMKSDQKNRTSQVSKDLTEMSEKIRYLHLCKTHIEMLQAELHSIDPSYLMSLATCPVEGHLKLKPSQENVLLQFQVLREPQTGCEVSVVNAGTVDGLISYLFATTSLSFGYVHQLFYGFRYFTTPKYLLKFLTDRYKMVTRVLVPETNHHRVQKRVIDLLYFWIEGFYSVDFEDNSEVLQEVQVFLQQNKIATVSEEGGHLQELLSMCVDGNSVDLMANTASGENVHVYKPGAPKKWDSVKAIISGKSASKEVACARPGFSMCVDRQGNNHTLEDVYFPKTARRTDAFALADYTSQTIAEQLTLIEQGIFQMTHPVHYLNSKSQGVSVALTMSVSRAPSLLKLNNLQEESNQHASPSLFVSKISHDSAMQRMIDHAHEVSHWVAGEIVSCSSSKSQVAVLSKFLYTAVACKEMRNYATCMAILDGLENLIIKQLPAWKNLPSKCITMMDELNSVRMFLKNDAMSLMKHSDSHLYPTIPAALLFLLHVQQTEIGSFQLANEMYKWSKIRSVAQVIDQIRIFKDHVYGYEADYDLQDTLMQRIREFSGQEIHAIASQHDTNYHKISSGGIGAAFRKMKGKFQSK